MRRKRVTFEERQRIEALIKEGMTGANIAYSLGLSTNGVNTEIRRSGGRESYSAEKAEELSKKRLEIRNKMSKQRFDSWVKSLEEKIDPLIKKGLSFWQVQKELKISYQVLHRVYSSLGIKPPLLSEIVETIQDKVYSLEEQVKVLFEMLENK